MERLQASGSSSKRPQSSPSSPKEVNDHIYELYKPTEDPSMDILFFHGLQLGGSAEAYKSTWTCGDGSGQIWPSTWLVEEFPKAHVFSVSYDASMMRTEEQGRFDLYSVAENLIQAICWADIGQVLGRPVILVGHSFGGLVIKSLCVKADHTHGLRPSTSESTQKIERFLQNIGGVFFYGTPHRGSSLFDEAASFLGGPLLLYVKVLSIESARLESEFTSVCKKYGIWHILSVGESLPTSWGLFQGGLVVPEASARYGPHFCTATSNHITLCQPMSKTSTSFQRLKDFLQGIHAKVQVEDRQVEARFENMQQTPKPLVGVELAISKVEDMLWENEKVGLIGMGGVGKTTLARAVFNKIAPKFEYSCFIPVVKLISGSVEDVKQEAWNYLHCRGKKVDDDYKRGCWSRLTGKPLLLVLDDISEKSNRDLDVLLAIAHDMGTAESRFIVTSRDGDRLNKMDEVYRVPFLDDINAKQLFMSCAFPKMPVPPIALESNVEAIMQKCGGLPLTLELIGNYLRRKTNVKVWKQTLEDLDKANTICDPDERLWAQLRLSYDSLRENEQEMFLDVTTFFAGTHWTLREAKEAWNVIYGSEDRRWQTLLDMSLVYDVKEDEGILVHEQLQSLGRKIASETKKNRIWNSMEALKLLESTDESDDVQVHSLRLGSRPYMVDINISRSAYCRLKTVQCLDLIGKPIDWYDAQEDETFPTDHLVLLGCNGKEFGYLCSKFVLGRLVVLRLHWSWKYWDPIENDLHGFIGQLSTLKILNLADWYWTSLPDEIGCLSQLECLRLLNCKSLQKLPESFGELLNLKDLGLICCSALKTLPKSFGQLSALEYLKLTESDCIVTVPHSFGHLPALQHLEFEHCSELQILPDSFGHLPALQHLEFIHCRKLHILPDSFGHLPTLQHLEFVKCFQLHMLPNSFGQLPKLQHLEFVQCSQLRNLPDSFGHLPALLHLKFHMCPEMYELPKSFGHLPALKHLEFRACHKLHILPESFGQLSTLESVEFHSCSKLTDVPETFGQLAMLQNLVIDACPEMKNLPNSLMDLKNLCCLSIAYIGLRSIPDFIETLPSLQTLQLGFLPWLICFPPWLGETTLTSPTMSVLRIFQVQDGRFALNLPGEQDVAAAKEWIRVQLRDHFFAVRDDDEAGALATVESWGSRHLMVILRDLFSNESNEWWIRIWRKRSILKLLIGDLPGALEDFDGVVEKCVDIQGRTASMSDTQHLEYICRLERGYVRYLLNDMDGAQEDAKVAFKYQSRIKDLLVFEYNLHDASREYAHLFCQIMARLSVKGLVRQPEILLYLRLAELGMAEYKVSVNLVKSSYSAALEKVARSDFAGALADLRFDAVDFRMVGFRVQAFILQERGIFKRSMGDFNGALDDLNSALKLISDRQFKGGVLRFTSGYQCLKQRGLVKYMRGDLDGARDDATTAVRKFNGMPRHRSIFLDCVVVPSLSFSAWEEDEAIEILEAGYKIEFSEKWYTTYNSRVWRKQKKV